MGLHGWASFAWVADYGQFYLIDAEDADFVPPMEITDDMLETSCVALSSGAVVYTADCLQQRIDIAIHETAPDASPVERMSDNPWTRTRELTLAFPSRRFAISSPSHPTPLPGGPFFLLESPRVAARISWLEHDGGREDSGPVEPDVIEIALWPA